MRSTMASPWRTMAVGTMAAAVAVGAAACSGDGDEAGAPPASGSAEAEAAEGACALLAAEDVSGLFGADAAVVPAGEGASSERSCLWEATSEGGDFPTRHQLQLSVYDDGRPLDPSAWGEGAEPVSDLGDEAFVVRSGPLGAAAGYRQGERSVVLLYAVVGGEGAPAPGDQADELVELLRTAASGS